jgi:hypothetical protein
MPRILPPWVEVEQVLAALKVPHMLATIAQSEKSLIITRPIWGYLLNRTSPILRQLLNKTKGRYAQPGCHSASEVPYKASRAAHQAASDLEQLARTTPAVVTGAARAVRSTTPTGLP